MNSINILENFIDGLEFEDLTPEDVFKMIPVVGIAKIIRKLPGHSDKVSTCKFRYGCSYLYVYVKKSWLSRHFFLYTGTGIVNSWYRGIKFSFFP